MLGKGPVRHYGSRYHHENETRYSLRCNIEAQPLINLSRIVRTSHDVEQEPTRDLVATSIRFPKISQQNMAIEVGDLAKHPESKANFHLELVHGCVKRVVDVIRNPSAESPVISTVPEDVCEGRCCMAESVHEEGLHDTFEVVETPVIHGVCLNRVDDAVLFVAKDLVYGKVIEDGIENQRAQVLPEEKSAITDLCPEILENNS